MDEPADALILVDRIIHETGEFDALEFLLRRGWLDGADHLAWRRGALASLQDALLAPVDAVIATLEQAVRHAKSQGLQRTPRPAAQSPTGVPLPWGRDPHFTLLCSGLLKPPADRHQGDLFQNNAEVFVLDALHRALAEGDADGAGTALVRLRALSPRLADRHQPLLAGLACTGPAVERVDQLESALAPLAQQLLKARSAAYLAPLWAEVAARLQAHGHDPAQPQLHASHAWLRAGHWRQAAASVIASGPGWVREPVLLQRMIAIETGLHRVIEARRWRLRLCWLFPHQARADLESLAATEPDRALRRAWLSFRDSPLALPVEEFPSWLLLAEPQQRDWLPPEDPAYADLDVPALHHWRLLHALLCAPADIDRRRQLKQAQPALLQLFLAQRERQRL